MSDAKHTPGPWKVHHTKATTQQAGSVFIGANGETEPVAEVLGQINDPVDGERSKSEQLANARLLAAAPDLLAALRDECEGINLDTLYSMDLDRVQRGLVAIRKAMGK